MKTLHALFVAAGATLLAACGGATEITVENLEGTWDGTSFVFTNKANTSETVDIIAVQGATMTVTVQADGNTTSTFDDGQGNTSSNSGLFSAEGETLTLAGVAYQASLDGDRMTLTNADAAYDFDDDGSDDPATVRITFRRQ